MSKVTDNQQNFDCPLEATLQVIGGKWATFILYRLLRGDQRYGELKRLIPGVTEKMLIQNLRELEAEGIIRREVHHQVPPKVVYSLTEKGLTLRPVLDVMCQWGKAHSGRWRPPQRAVGVVSTVVAARKD